MGIIVKYRIVIWVLNKGNAIERTGQYPHPHPIWVIKLAENSLGKYRWFDNDILVLLIVNAMKPIPQLHFRVSL